VREHDTSETSRAGLKLIVGLGNPGGRHVGTRHNVGFEVVNLLAMRAGVRLRRGRFRSHQARGRLADADVLLMQPHTYVNRAGGAVRAACNYYRLVELSDLLVICDDVNLPLGKLRLRRSGSGGGHNGLDSIIEALGTQGFTRLRVGVGAPPPYMEQSAYVLGRFAAEEREEIAAAIARAAEAGEAWVAAGIDEAMNRFN